MSAIGKAFRFCLILLISNRIYSQSKHPTIQNDSNKVYGWSMDIQEQPKFYEEFNKYFADSIRYPREAREKNIQGTVYVSFIVEKNGAVSTIKVLRTDNEMLTNEAIRVISDMPRWKPGKKDGKAIRVQYITKVNFRL